MAAPAERRATGAHRVLRWLPYLALVAVAVVALVVGSEVQRPHPSLEQETMSIAGQVRCPVCDGETAAESDTAPSLAIRAEIRHDLLAGEKTPAILGSIVAAYGPGILEKPSAHGANLLLWVLPVVVAALMVAGLAAAFAYWRSRRVDTGASDDDRALVADALRREAGG